jgi:holo-[acyl-carrier protein] synthase
MIVGTGVDIIEIERVKKAHLQHGSRFLKRLFTNSEIKYCFKKKDPYPSLAGRFAAKEAVIKAFGRGFRGRWKWTQIEVTREPSGKPGIRLSGLFGKLRRERKIHGVHVSLAHGRRNATASVVLESK